MKYIILIFLVFCCNTSYAYHWVQKLKDDELWLRYIAQNQNHCPEVKIADKSYKMQPHSLADENFPLTCKLLLNDKNTANGIYFNGKKIDIKSARDVKKILVIGDTGCVVSSHVMQDCKNNWPFAKIAEISAKHKPDLIIHVGDYVYRGKDFADNFATWEIDFFKPVDKLLTAAPWIMVRGNHEECARKGNGWFTLFANEKIECADYTLPYKMDVKQDLQFTITDSVKEENLILDLEKIIANQKKKNAKTWILTHRPLIFSAPTEDWYNTNSTVAGYKKILNKLPEYITLLLSGHIHSLQMLKSDKKMQIIAGNGGALLYKVANIEGVDVKTEFGFLIIEFKKDKILFTGYNKNNEKIMIKTLKN